MTIDLAVPRSKLITSFKWTGPQVAYPEPEVKGDTYPMTWADDDEIYTSSGDPLWGESKSGLDVEKFSGSPPDYKITKVNHMKDYTGWGGNGPKPSGMISVKGVLYLAFQNLRHARKAPHGLLCQHGSDAHIVYSTTRGQFWVPSIETIRAPMFPEHHFGGPAFINCGKDNADAPDNYVYAVSSDQWDNGSNLRLGRVPGEEIVRAEAWEWVCAFDPAGEPAWTHELEEAIPVLSLHRFLSIPDMVYLASIERYLMLTWRFRQDFSSEHGTDLLILEAPKPWGPFSLVHYEECWEGIELNPYCPRLPLKWMTDNQTAGWIVFSGNWSPAGQKVLHYRAHVHPFKLTLR